MLHGGGIKMNEKFLELSKEKQMRIINAAMEVFGTNEYKHAVTDDIARKAGISKGLLFYYFKNKKSLYQFVYQYCLNLLVETIEEAGIHDKTDFFEIMRYGADKKMELIANHSYIMEFCLKAYYMNDENIGEEINEDIQQRVNTMFADYFSHIDLYKFKEGIDPFYIFQMMQWMADGYIRTMQKTKDKLDINEIMKDYDRWEEMFKQMVYRKEYL